uniref:Uncharacterized protein n=1 Tax=Meloidogyne floridensis TaxID=298350 RepID=A0A915PGV5_9BILA
MEKIQRRFTSELFNNLIQLKNHRFEVGLFPFKKINNNEYLPKHNFYIKITEKYDVCNFDENELSTDGGKALSLQNNIYFIKVWWNKMLIIDSMQISGVDKILIIQLKNNPSFEEKQFSNVKALDLGRPKRPLSIPFECNEVLFEGYVVNLYLINVQKVQDNQSSNSSTSFVAFCNLNMENPIEINEGIIIQQWEGYKRMYPEFQTRNKRKGKEIIYNPSNKQKTVQILDKSNAQILVDLTKDNKNQNEKCYKELINIAKNRLSNCKEAINEFEDYKNKFLEKENLKFSDEFDEGKIKRIENFIKEIEQYNAYIEGYEDQLRDTINELNNCSSFVEGKGKKIEDTPDIFQQDPKLCELEALASKQLKEDWKLYRGLLILY